MLLGVSKIGQGTGKEHAEACLATLDQWSMTVHCWPCVWHNCQQYWFEEWCKVHAPLSNSPWDVRWHGWLVVIISWSYCWPSYFMLCLGQQWDRMSVCSRDSSKRGHSLIRQSSMWRVTTWLTLTHLLFRPRWWSITPLHCQSHIQEKTIRN